MAHAALACKGVAISLDRKIKLHTPTTLIIITYTSHPLIGRNTISIRVHRNVFFFTNPSPAEFGGDGKDPYVD